MYRLPLAALIYGGAFHNAYTAFINPTFEYAHYLYFEPSLVTLLFTYTLIAAPVVAFRARGRPAEFGSALIFGLCYVPAQLVLLFLWQRSAAELAVNQALLALSMAFILRASTLGTQRVRAGLDTSIRKLAVVIGFLTVVSLIFVVSAYGQHMQLVSFEDVYDLRFETSKIDVGALGGYLIMWLSYSFLPYYYARGIIQRRSMDFLVGIMGSILVYAATGAKAIILLPVIVFTLNLLFGSGKSFMLRLIAMLALLLFLLTELVKDDGSGVGFWVKSIFMLRILATGGWNMAAYYDYFSTNGFTYYTHIGPVNALTGAYPYGQNSLGQVIGIEYSGSEQANFNANFWASDGYAALGMLGIPVVTAAVCLMLIAINRISSGHSIRFVVLWLSGFWLAMLNLPLTTALLSGGGAVTLLLLWATHAPRRHRAQSSGGDQSAYIAAPRQIS
jgi:hypothetical protein